MIGEIKKQLIKDIDIMAEEIKTAIEKVEAEYPFMRVMDLEIKRVGGIGISDTINKIEIIARVITG